VTMTIHPHLVPRSWKSTAIPLLPLWVHVACYRVKPYLTIPYMVMGNTQCGPKVPGLNFLLLSYQCHLPGRDWTT